MFQGQTLEQARTVGRPEKQFWYLQEEPPYGVREVTGLEAGGDAWWVPEVGVTAHEGQQLFLDEEKAKTILRGLLLRQRDTIDAALKKLGK